MLFAQNLFEPMSLAFGAGPIRAPGIVIDDEFLSAAIATKRAHLGWAWHGCSFSRLTFLDCYRPHRKSYSLLTDVGENDKPLEEHGLIETPVARWIYWF
jgi:hypothetical protein